MKNDELNFNIEEYPYLYTHKEWDTRTKTYITIDGLYDESNLFGFYLNEVYDSYQPLTIGSENYELYSFLWMMIEFYFSKNNTNFLPLQVAVKFIDYKERIEECRNVFATITLLKLLPHLEEWNNKYNLASFFGNLTKEELLTINNIVDTSSNDSSQSGDSSESSKSGNNVLQKYATSPTAVEPSEGTDTLVVNTENGSFSASGFQSKYQNTSANTEQLNTSETSRTNSTTRKGNANYTRKHTGNISLITDIYNKLPKGFVDEVLECVSPLFINVE